MHTETKMTHKIYGVSAGGRDYVQVTQQLGEINADTASLDCRVHVRTVGFVIAAINKANSTKALAFQKIKK